jgi:hypothetical protein
VYVDDDENIIGEEDEDEEVTDEATPSFSLTIGEEGAVSIHNNSVRTLPNIVSLCGQLSL